MAHAPEWPQLYVCDECNAVYAGNHRADDREHEFHPPDACSACGDDSFTEIEMIPQH